VILLLFIINMTMWEDLNSVMGAEPDFHFVVSSPQQYQHYRNYKQRVNVRPTGIANDEITQSTCTEGSMPPSYLGLLDPRQTYQGNSRIRYLESRAGRNGTV
jgi:hypothetical protein